MSGYITVRGVLLSIEYFCQVYFLGICMILSGYVTTKGMLLSYVCYCQVYVTIRCMLLACERY